jgi:hypothetical protein
LILKTALRTTKHTKHTKAEALLLVYRVTARVSSFAIRSRWWFVCFVFFVVVTAGFRLIGDW